MAKHLDDPNTQSNSESRELAKDQPKLLAIVDCPPELGPVARQEWDPARRSAHCSGAAERTAMSSPPFVASLVAASSASPMFLSFDWKKSRCGSSTPTAPASQSGLLRQHAVSKNNRDISGSQRGDSRSLRLQFFQLRLHRAKSWCESLLRNFSVAVRLRDRRDSDRPEAGSMFADVLARRLLQKLLRQRVFLGLTSVPVAVPAR
jgi:hypothetical protein